MRVVQIFTNSINNNRQNSAKVTFGYGISIETHVPKLKGRDNQRYFNQGLITRIEKFLLDRKDKLKAVVDGVKTAANVSEEVMNTIRLRLQLKSNVEPEVVVTIKSIDDTTPITISEWDRLLEFNIANRKTRQILDAVETKAKESAALAKQAASAKNATQSTETFVATA